jgi:cytochrome c oxidase cbb3-type subunit 2
MTRNNRLIVGACAAVGLSWFAMTVLAQIQLGGLQPQVNEEEGDVYPIAVGGVMDQGRSVYVANGCFYCHTQQVKDDHAGPDIDRKWGTRRTVARDYLYEKPVTLGSMRIGPDLANVGTRREEGKFEHSPEWHYLHLYDARTVRPGSLMPPFRYLFREQKITGERSAEALDLKGENAPREGYEVVPKAEAKALVGYLQSLNRTHPLAEVSAGAAAPAAPAPAPAASPEAKK